VLKRWFKSLCFASLLTATGVFAAEYGELSERSAGRILGVRMAKGYHFFVFLRPMPMDTWLCRDYLSGEEAEIYPAKMELMPFFDQDDDFAIEVLTCWHILHNTPESVRYRAFAQLVNLPRVSSARQFIETVRRQGVEIDRLRRENASSRSSDTQNRFFSKNGCGCSAGVQTSVASSFDQSAANGAIADLITQGEVFRELEAVLQMQDYFLAIELLRYYRQCVNQWLGRSMADYPDVVQKFENVERTFVTNYRIDHEKDSLKNDFERVCPRQRGLWKQAVPRDFNEMIQRNTAAFQSWQKSRELSSECDFPEWGCCMLDILSMMPGLRETDPVIMQFKNALKQYQDVFADGVN